MRCYFNLLSLNGLNPSRSLEDIRRAGYDGVQFVDFPHAEELTACRKLGLEYAGSGRVNEPGDAFVLAERLSNEGIGLATLHVGWGIESEREAARLVESVIEAAQRHSLELYVETHRATIFQDMWRSVEMARAYPELRFNGDFSHWYTGQEMVYGGFERKLAFIRPVLERVRFLHGRIGNPGCMQVPVASDGEDKSEYVAHFRRLWTECFRYGAQIFTTELLSADIYYAQRNNEGREDSDRWEQSLVLRKIAEECYAQACD